MEIVGLYIHDSIAVSPDIASLDHDTVKLYVSLLRRTNLVPVLVINIVLLGTVVITAMIRRFYVIKDDKKIQRILSIVILSKLLSTKARVAKKKKKKKSMTAKIKPRVYRAKAIS